MFNIRVCVSLVLLILATSRLSAADPERWKQYLEAIVKVSTDPEYVKLWPEHIKKFKDIREKAFPTEPVQANNFPCQTYTSPSVPTSVHNLQPGDIKVIGAMGDSITAGNGINADTPVGVLNEDRGHSWSVGGVSTYEEVLTIPNILKKYNPSITGFATGTGNRDSGVARLNVAFPGKIAENMPEQAELLVNRIRGLSGVDFQNDWKMVTLFIGGNDLCYYCSDENRYAVNTYRDHIRDALDYLKANLPRTFVNVASILDISAMSELPDNTICDLVHSALCSCISSSPGVVGDIARQYSDVVSQLISSGRYNDQNDFTVVFQPFMRDNDLPRFGNGEPDRSYFSPDCFHFSAKGHAAVATMLWNGMFEPVGNKKTSSSYSQNLICPSQGQLIPTSQNSRSFEHLDEAQVQVQMVQEAIGENPGQVSPQGNLPLILGVTCSVGLLAAVALVGLIVYRKRRTPMEDLTVLTNTY